MNVLWLQSGGCGGCSMSLLCADTADFPAMLKAGGIELLWHPSLSLASGRELIALLEDCRGGHQRLDVLCVEGSLLRGPNGTGRFHLLAGTGVPMIDWVRRLAGVARHEVGEQAQQVVNHLYLTVAAHARPDADGGDVQAARDLGG